jgi:dienelactone hydrolase
MSYDSPEMPRPGLAAFVSLTLWALVAAHVPLRAQQPHAQSLPQAPQPRPGDPPHETLFYQNGPMRLEAYFFKPSGSGPFPLVVYSHGARANEERIEWPVYFIARVVVPVGYALLVPERRGYGRSEGATFTEEIGPDERGKAFMDRMTLEAGDVNAAVDYARKRLPIDSKRIVLMGYSFGGIVTTLAASSNNSLRAVVNQAPGALNWDRSAELRAALTAAASKIHVPMICMAAENDMTTENARVICDTAKASGANVEIKIYPPFTAPTNPNPRAPGHALFSPVGVDHWKQDLLDFLAKHVI